jgi:hypothetical protein
MLSAECFAPTIAPSNPNNQQIAVSTTCIDTWKLYVGAIAGLVGGRNQTDNDQTGEEQPHLA